MAESSSRQFACLDANVFLAVLLPEVTKAPKDEITGAARVLRGARRWSLARNLDDNSFGGDPLRLSARGQDWLRNRPRRNRGGDQLAIAQRLGIFGDTCRRMEA